MRPYERISRRRKATRYRRLAFLLAALGLAASVPACAPDIPSPADPSFADWATDGNVLEPAGNSDPLAGDGDGVSDGNPDAGGTDGVVDGPGDNPPGDRGPDENPDYNPPDGGSNPPAGGDPEPQLHVSAAELDFGATSSSQSIGVGMAGSTPLHYVITPSADWISVSPERGETWGELDVIDVTVARRDLGGGPHQGMLTIVTNTGLLHEVSVRLVVETALACDASQLDFGTGQLTQSFTLRNSGDGTIPYTITTDVDWLQVVPTEGELRDDVDTVTLSADRVSLAVGPHEGLLTINTPGSQTFLPVLIEQPELQRISGYIRYKGTGVAGVTVAGDNGAGSTVTTSSGFYALEVPNRWFGTLRPTHPDHHFDPPNRCFGTVVVGVDNVDFAARPSSDVVPAFAVLLADGTYHHYSGNLSYDDEHLSAQVQPLGDDQWELSLRSKNQVVEEVWFPWEPERYCLNPDISDDVLYVCSLFGVAIKADTFEEFDWEGLPYPGAVSPLLVIADQQRAKIVAATNWPPKEVWAVWSLQRTCMKYEVSLEPLETHCYRALVAEADGDAAAGLYPWQLALDRYGAWFYPTLEDAGLYPVEHTPFFRQANGWLNYQLNGWPEFSPYALEQHWQRWGEYFGWIQFWGQMSNFSGPSYQAVPPLEPGEQTGCCLVNRVMHPRYLPELTEFMQQVQAEGGYAGLYSRPRDEVDNNHLDNPEVVNGETNAEFLLEWLRRSQQDYGANAFYIDTLGQCNYGDALFVATLFQTSFPPDIVIEGAIDLYPGAFLLSGILHEDDRWGGTYGYDIADLGNGFDSMSYPAFGRYLLGDHAVFLGESNRDWDLWGPENQCWVERQAFLLGAKLDVMHPFEDFHTQQIMNRALVQIFAEWERVDWWSREPVYRDRAGIRDVPAGVDVRHFVDNYGAHLLVIDNWDQQVGLSFVFNGRPVAVPTEQLSILIAGDTTGN